MIGFMLRRVVCREHPAAKTPPSPSSRAVITSGQSLTSDRCIGALLVNGTETHARRRQDLATSTCALLSLPSLTPPHLSLLILQFNTYFLYFVHHSKKKKKFIPKRSDCALMSVALHYYYL